MQLFCLDFGCLTSSLSQPRHDSDVLLLHLTVNIFVVSVDKPGISYFSMQWKELENVLSVLRTKKTEGEKATDLLVSD